MISSSSNAESLGVVAEGRKGLSSALIIALVGLTIAFGLSYWRFFAYCWQRWTEEHGPFGYGYFIPPSIAYLIWCHRDSLRELPSRSGPWWAWALAFGFILLNAAAIVAAVTIVQSLTFLALLLLIPLCVWGPTRFRLLWAPLLYGATMIPWPGQITSGILFDMQQLSVKMALKLFSWLGFNPYAEGITVMLPRFNFEVAPACAGLTILFPTVACTILTVMMTDAALWRKFLLVGLSVPVSIATNGGRILLIGLIGNAGGTDLANTLHDASGLFGVVVCVLILSGIGSLIGCSRYHDIYMPKWAREEPE